MRKRSGLLSFLTMSTLTACGNPAVPPDTQTLSKQSGEVASSLIDASLQSISALSDAASFASIGSAFSNLGSVWGSTDASTGLAKLRASHKLGFGPHSDTTSEPVQDANTALRAKEFLEQRLFVADNEEAKDVDSATYLLHGSIVCKPLDSDVAACPSCDHNVDIKCVQNVDAAQLRIRASAQDANNFKFEFLVGPQRLHPIDLTIGLAPKGLAAEIDLAATKDAAKFIHDAVQDANSFEAPTVAQGKVRLAMTVNGDQDVSFDLGVLSAITVQGNDPNGHAVSIALAVSDPILDVRVQGTLQKLTATLNLKALDLSVPYADVIDNANNTESLVLHLAGASFTTAFDQHASQAWTIANLGLGDGTSTVKKGGDTLLSIDLNASQGRHFTLVTAADTAHNSATFTVSPAFNLQAMFAFQAIAADLPESFPSFLLNETYTIDLSGSTGAAILPRAESANFGGGIQVTTGALTLSSTASSTPVTVATGMCLVGRSDVPTDGHPLLGHFYEASCPE